MKIEKLVLIIILFIGVSALYKKFNSNEDKRNNKYYNSLIETYLLNKESFGFSYKPILWIYLQNDSQICPAVNNRFWINFGSRNSSNFNQPYQIYTIQSIIKNCSDDFNICLIDDTAFNILLPQWTTDLNNVAQPMKNHMQMLALTALINAYGGMCIPSSFVCFKSLYPIYNQAVNENKIAVGQLPNQVCNENLQQPTIANPIFMASASNNETLQCFHNYLLSLNAHDLTRTQDFLGLSSLWLETKIQSNEIISICGCKLGVQRKDKTLIYAEDLLKSSYIELDKEAYGIYIPWDQLINRTSLDWFVKLTPEEVLNSNTQIAKHLLIHQ
jgi:hypothetical protein